MFKAISGFFAAFGAIGIFALISLWVAVIVGYFMNIYKLVTGTDWSALDIEAALRLVGIVFAPIGSIMGLFVS